MNKISRPGTRQPLVSELMFPQPLAQPFQATGHHPLIRPALPLRPLALAVLALTLVAGLGAGGRPETSPATPAPVAPAAPRVLASTPWTAAFALAAGATDLTVLAPADLRHPPEYELKPTDLLAVAKADLVVYAGYERMVPKLVEAVGQEGVPMVQITTTHNRATLRQSVEAIAARLGTQEAAAWNLTELMTFLDDWSAELGTTGWKTRPLAVHAMQAALLRDLGANVVATFGPAPLEAKQIADLSASGAVLIIDNWHNPVARVLEETMPGVRRVEFINFPGLGGTRTLREVLAWNRDLLRPL